MQLFPKMTVGSPRELAKAAVRAHAGSQRQNTFLHAIGQATSARCRCACDSAAPLPQRHRPARACTHGSREGPLMSKLSRGSWCGLRSAFEWILWPRATAENDWPAPYPPAADPAEGALSRYRGFQTG